jgi:hypothetical protein
MPLGRCTARAIHLELISILQLQGMILDSEIIPANFIRHAFE